MCFRPQTDIMTAEEDITVYKVFTSVVDEIPSYMAHYESPYAHFFYGTVIEEQEFVCHKFGEHSDTRTFLECRGYHNIFGFHSFKFKKDAFKEKYFLNIESAKDNEINNVFECIIPKGSRYMRGVDAFNHANYVSERIKPIKPLKHGKTS